MTQIDDVKALLAARTDPETGLVIEAVFLDRLDQSMSLAQRAAQTSAVAIIVPEPRTDGSFVAYGKAMVTAAAVHARTTDTFGELGDNQIGVLLPLVKPGFAQTIFQRLLASAAEECARAGHLEITARAAFATATSATGDPVSMLEGIWADLAGQTS